MTRHWNQCRSSFRKGEPIEHVKAKQRLGEIGKKLGFRVIYEYPVEVTPELDFARTYWIDVVWERKPPRGQKERKKIQIFIEADGGIHRASACQIDKTKKKSAHVLECHNIKIVHFTTEDLNGKYELSDAEIWKEIQRQLENEAL